MEDEVRQLKLANGEEILCEVMQWSEGDDFEILVRKAMRLIDQEFAVCSATVLRSLIQ